MASSANFFVRFFSSWLISAPFEIRTSAVAIATPETRPRRDREHEGLVPGITGSWAGSEGRRAKRKGKEAQGEKIRKLTSRKIIFQLSKMARMIFCACFHGCGRRVVADSAVDAVARGRIGKYHQSRDWISRSAHRHSSIAFGCAQCWQRRFFCRHNHFRGDDSSILPPPRALPCLDAEPCK